MSASKLFQIQDSVAFVTGTNKKNGIGRAIVEALLESGAKKVYATSRESSQLDELVAAHSGKVIAVELDVTDFDAIEQLSVKYPDVNLVVNNAGFFGMTASVENDLAVAIKEIEVNYFAPLAIVRSFADILKQSKSSGVVNINSIASLINFPAGGTYSASKAAEHSLTQAQRRELPTTLVVGVYPGPIDTDMAKDLPFDKTSPMDVANIIVDALKTGAEDVYPDAMAQQMHEGWKSDAKMMEQQMAKSTSFVA